MEAEELKQKEGYSYTLDELKEKIQEFKEYLIIMSHKHCRNIGVDFYWEVHEYSPYIFDNHLLTAINIDRV